MHVMWKLLKEVQSLKALKLRKSLKRLKLVNKVKMLEVHKNIASVKSVKKKKKDKKKVRKIYKNSKISTKSNQVLPIHNTENNHINRPTNLNMHTVGSSSRFFWILKLVLVESMHGPVNNVEGSTLRSSETSKVANKSKTRQNGKNVKSA